MNTHLKNIFLGIGIILCFSCNKNFDEKISDEKVFSKIIAEFSDSSATERIQPKINTKLQLDLDCLYQENCRAENLDILFNRQGYSYTISDYTGTSHNDYYCHILNLFKNSVYENSYVLFYDKNDILRDTLQLKDKKMVLNVIFENNKRGIALGYFDDNDFNNVYFEITNLYILDNNIKLHKTSLETRIKNCPLPLDYLSEEYVGIEDFYNYGVKEQIKQTLSN